VLSGMTHTDDFHWLLTARQSYYTFKLVPQFDRTRLYMWRGPMAGTWHFSHLFQGFVSFQDVMRWLDEEQAFIDSRPLSFATVMRTPDFFSDDDDDN
jgi:hypothetical protein